MARIAGVDIPRESASTSLCLHLWHRPSVAGRPATRRASADTKMRDLTEDEVTRIVKSSTIIVEGDLRREVRQNIQRLTESIATAACATVAAFRCAASARRPPPYQAGRPSHRRRQAQGDRQEVIQNETGSRSQVKQGFECCPASRFCLLSNGVETIWSRGEAAVRRVGNANESRYRKAALTSSRPSTTRSSRSPTPTVTCSVGAVPARPTSRARARARPSPPPMAAEGAARRAMEHGLRQIDVYVKGPGSGREGAIRALQASGLNVLSIRDVTPIPHNGCRAPKRRRV